MSKTTKGRKKPLLNRIFNQLVLALIIWGICIYTGARLFEHFEGVRLIDAFYWAIQVATTTGPGDVTPKTDEGKILFMIYNHLVSVFLLLYVGANIVLRVIKNADLMSHDEQEWQFWVTELIYGMVAWMVVVLYRIAQRGDIPVPPLRHQRSDGSMPPCPPQPHDTGKDAEDWSREQLERQFA